VDTVLGLVKQIFLDPTREARRVVVFAAVDHGNGCSQVAAAAAETLAMYSSRAVCLVEANFRSPALSRILGTTNYQGLTDVLKEPSNFRSFLKPTRSEKSCVLTSGLVNPDSPELLTPDRMKVLQEELLKQFDFVVVDAPPVSRYGEAIALGKSSDGMVLILEAGSTDRKTAHKTVKKLEGAGVRILGVVLNKRTLPIPRRIYNMLGSNRTPLTCE
jgi:capsular exopolysaccharide synthesis family protein